MRLSNLITRVHLAWVMMRPEQRGCTRCFARLSAPLEEYRLPPVSPEGVAHAAD